MALKITVDRMVKISLISSKGMGELDPKLPMDFPGALPKDLQVETNKLFIPTGMTVKIKIEYGRNSYTFKFTDWRFKPKKGRGNDAWADWDIQGKSHSQHFDAKSGRHHTLVTSPFTLKCVHVPTHT